MPTVSVIIPLYNTEKYVHQAISSVLAQTFTDFEIIVVDDGSTDQSLDVCRGFRDPRIRLISQKNRGLAGARNTGIRHARGQFIALLDADDAWAPEKLALHVAHLQQRPHIGISYSQSAFMDDEGMSLGIVQTPKLNRVTDKDILCRNPVGNGSAPVIRKAVFDQIAYQNPNSGNPELCYFDEQLRQSEDIDCWLRIACQTPWRFEGLNLPLTCYRVNDAGLSANLNKQFQNWLVVREKARRYAPELIERYGQLAESFQLRYMARRAIRSRNAEQATQYLLRSLRTDWRIAFYEPLRTAVTLVCSLFLRMMPSALYARLEACAMQGVGVWRKLHPC